MAGGWFIMDIYIYTYVYLICNAYLKLLELGQINTFTFFGPQLLNNIYSR